MTEIHSRKTLRRLQRWSDSVHTMLWLHRIVLNTPATCGCWNLNILTVHFQFSSATRGPLAPLSDSVGDVLSQQQWWAALAPCYGSAHTSWTHVRKQRYSEDRRKCFPFRFTDAACWRKIIHCTYPFQPHPGLCFSWKNWDHKDHQWNQALGLEYNILGRCDEECGPHNKSPESSAYTGQSSSLAGLPPSLHRPRVKAV